MEEVGTNGSSFTLAILTLGILVMFMLYILQCSVREAVMGGYA